MNWLVIAVLLATNALTIFAWQNSRSDAAASAKSVANQENYPLLARRIFVDNPSDVIINFSPLRAALNQYFETNVTAKHSFYFEYLPTGSTIRINSNEELVGASLLKLPVAMNAYKAAELGKIDLDQTITLKQEWLDPLFGELHKRGPGQKLTLRQLIEQVLRYSDNTAANAIHATISPLLPDDQHALVELDVPHTITDQQRAKIGAQSYTSLLKCLYFSCFINEQHSQEMLDYMTKAADEGRIGAGVPNDIPVAHKIGTFSQLTEGDCGIVYVQNRNYSLCLIIDLPSSEANRHFQAVSSLTYQYLSAQ